MLRRFSAWRTALTAIHHREDAQGSGLLGARHRFNRSLQFAGRAIRGGDKRSRDGEDTADDVEKRTRVDEGVSAEECATGSKPGGTTYQR